jgi:heptosyltransferase-2
MFVKSFPGIWNRLPFERKYSFTDFWMQQDDEQLPDRQLFWEAIRRVMLVYALGESHRYRSRLPRGAQNILWIHMTDHIGDSLMRLSPVQLLSEKTVDLLADEKATLLFEPGGYFRKVMRLSDDNIPLDAEQYDCVILDALHTKPILAKHRLLKKTPFVTQNDLFHYCRDDYNLTLCSWCRMEYLLDQRVEKLAERARLVLDAGIANSAEPQEYFGIQDDALGIVVGGREEYRIYPYWNQVVELLLEKWPGQQLVLLGSEQAGTSARDICNRFPGKNIVNCVNRCSLGETAALISACRLLLCADGGLLHVAGAMATPTVCLFAQEYPAFRYTPADRFRALRSNQHVRTIEPEAIFREVELAWIGQWQQWNGNIHE